MTEPTYTGALRLHVVPDWEKRTLRLEYHANDPLNPNVLPLGEPVFFEDLEWEDNMSRWASQLVVGDMATVMGSGFFADALSRRHFRAQADPGEYNTTGSGLGG